MIDEKDIQEALEWADGYTKVGCPEAVTLAAAYREKCEECDLWQKSEKECNEAYRKLSKGYEALLFAARVMYNELHLYHPNSRGMGLLEEIIK